MSFTAEHRALGQVTTASVSTQSSLKDVPCTLALSPPLQ